MPPSRAPAEEDVVFRPLMTDLESTFPRAPGLALLGLAGFELGSCAGAACGAAGGAACGAAGGGELSTGFCSLGSALDGCSASAAAALLPLPPV